MPASIIIVNWNGKEHLEKCLNTIFEKTQYPDYEVIIVDNGSIDGSLEFIKNNYQSITLIENPKNLGFSRANNQGIRAASGEFIFLLNNDTEVREGWLSNAIKVAQSNPKIGIVGCKLIFPDGRIQHTGGYVTDAGIGKHYVDDVDGEREVEYVTGAAILIKKELIDKIGLLDEKFSPIYFEETDLCFRARAAGFKVVYTPNSLIIHSESATTGFQDWKYFVMNKNRLRFMFLNFSKRRLIKAIPWELLRIMKNIVKMRVHLLLKAYGANVLDAREILRNRRKR